MVGGVENVADLATRSEATSGRSLVMWEGSMCEERSDEQKDASEASAEKGLLEKPRWYAVVASLQPSFASAVLLSSM